MKKIWIPVAGLVLAGGLVLGSAAPVWAHTPSASITCTQAKVSLVSYDAKATADVTVDGALVQHGTFGGNYVKTFAFTSADAAHGSHRLVVSVVSTDGKQYNYSFDQMVKGCYATPTPTPTPTPTVTPPVVTPTPTPTVTPSPTPTPTRTPPVVTPSPTPSVTPSEPPMASPTPSVTPTTPVVVPPKSTPPTTERLAETGVPPWGPIGFGVCILLIGAVLFWIDRKFGGPRPPTGASPVTP